MKPTRKLGRHTVTFASKKESLAGAMLEAGQTNRTIARRTGLTDGKITYRSTKLKLLTGSNEGLRVAFRNGRGPFFRQYVAPAIAVRAQQIAEEIPPMLEHITPKIVEQ